MWYYAFMSSLGFIVFLSIFQGVITLSHYVVAKVAIASFGLSGVTAVWVMRGMLAVSFLFLLTSILTRYADNFISQTLYTLAAVWLGILVYLFLISVVFACALPFINASEFFVTHRIIISAIVFAIPAIFSIYGIINANTTVYTNYSVTLPHLPEQWKGKKIVVIADTHFGQIRGEGTAEKWVEKINAVHPELVLHAGDFYDGVKTDADVVAKAIAGIRAPYGVYFATGNHESFSDDQVYVNSLKKAGIKVLENDAVEANGLLIAGVSYKDSTDKESYQKTMGTLSQLIDTLKNYKQLDSDAPVLVIKHVPDNQEVLSVLGNALQVSGHSHHGQLWPFRYVTNAIFNGYDYGLNDIKNNSNSATDAVKVEQERGETKGVLKLLTTSGIGTWGPPLRTFTKSEIVVVTLN